MKSRTQHTLLTLTCLSTLNLMPRRNRVKAGQLTNKVNSLKIKQIITTVALLTCLSTAFAQGTAFTYQGRLNTTNGPASGTYNLAFSLFNTNAGGTAIAGPVTNSATAVTNGLFTVTIDFGPGVFTGQTNWLQIGVETNGAGTFTTLAPRQQLTPTPYAIYSANAGSATTASMAASVPASGIGAGTANISITGSALSAAYAGTAVMANIATAASTAATATNLIGNVSDAQLPATIARLSGTNNFTGTNIFAGVTIATNVNNVIVGVFTGNGGGLTNLNTAQFANSVLTNGQTGVNLSGVFSGNGVNVTNVNAAALNGLNATNFWQLGGNNVAAGKFLGSTNNQPVELWVNNTRALRLEPTANDTYHSNIVNVVGGSPGNFITPGVYGSVIVGGGALFFYSSANTNNSVSSDMSFIGGGYSNSIQTNAPGSFLGGGSGNSIQTDAYASFLGGGNGNSIQPNAFYSVLGGGNGNSIQTNASGSFLGGGFNNSIQTNASGSFLGGGGGNSIQTNAEYAMIPGGYWNVAAAYSFAAGNHAQATNTGAFVWGDDSTSTPVSSTNANWVTMRANGGYRLFSNSGLTAGVALAPNGTSWGTLSDRNAKKNFASVNSEAVLEKLAAIPIQQWNYKWEQDGDVPNIGPMAQDFKAAFYPGRDDKSITTLEYDGVELAAIQGLNQKLNEKDTEIQALKQSVAELKETLTQLTQQPK